MRKCVNAMIGLAILFTVLATGAAGDDAIASAAEKKGGKALERTRNTVRMLDDIYKTTVVLITDKYVNDTDDFPAGSAAIALFEAISKKGWHTVRLVDVSGEPYNDENVAQDKFEKEAVKQLKAGKDYYEKVEKRGKVRYLRAATSLPVVLEKCIMCHENYRQAKAGEPIGALMYTLKIE